MDGEVDKSLHEFMDDSVGSFLQSHYTTECSASEFWATNDKELKCLT